MFALLLSETVNLILTWSYWTSIEIHHSSSLTDMSSNGVRKYHYLKMGLTSDQVTRRAGFEFWALLTYLKQL